MLGSYGPKAEIQMAKTPKDDVRCNLLTSTIKIISSLSSSRFEPPSITRIHTGSPFSFSFVTLNVERTDKAHPPFPPPAFAKFRFHTFWRTGGFFLFILYQFPSGMLARTTVKCVSKFIDDDGVVHKEWTWWLKIAKDWSK